MANLAGFVTRGPYWLVEKPEPDKFFFNLNEFFDELYYRELSCGIKLSVRRGSLFVFDFSNYPPCAASPTRDNDSRFENSVQIVQSRVQIMNAFLLCLASSSLSVEKISISTFKVGHQDIIDINGTNFGGAIGTLHVVPGAGFPVEFGRAWVIGSDTIRAACDLLDFVLSEDEGVKGLDMLSLVHDALFAHESHNYSAALATVWSVCEVLVDRMWRTYVYERLDAINLPLNRKRRDRLTEGTEYTASIITEVLTLAGVLPTELFKKLDIARQARNGWLHSLKPVDRNQSSIALEAAGIMVSAALKREIHIVPSLRIAVP